MKSSPEAYLAEGMLALESGQPSIAYEIFNKGLSDSPAHAELSYRAALSLARCHSTIKAEKLVLRLLSTLGEDTPTYADLMSLAGRLSKDRWWNEGHFRGSKCHAAKSAEFYKKAFDLMGDLYPGINAASMFFIAGDESQSQEIADFVRNKALGLVKDNRSPNHWLLATIAEANLLLGRQAEALDWYCRARSAAGNRYGDLASMRRQIDILSNCINIIDDLKSLVLVPRIVVFTGAMIDAPGRDVARFPPQIERRVKESIVNELNRLSPRIGYCSAACGADILFIEAMLELGNEVNIVLPFQQEDFEKTSVSYAGERWQERFQRVLSSANQVLYATNEQYLNDQVLFQYSTSVLFGLALLRAERLYADVTCIAVYDSEDDRLPGGTVDNVSRWRDIGLKTARIDLKDLRFKYTGTEKVYERLPSPVASDNSDHSSNLRISREVKAIIFADVVGFSKIGDAKSPNFSLYFLSEVAEIISSLPQQPVYKNTWGDGIVLVYNDEQAAAKVALYLRDMIDKKDWQSVGLPGDTSIRIGMHAGPVYPCMDPIIGRTTFYGSHVNLAARIEPVAPPGSIFVTEHMACLLRLSGNDKLVCDYLGPIGLAKNFGERVLYRLRRKGESE